MEAQTTTGLVKWFGHYLVSVPAPVNRFRNWWGHHFRANAYASPVPKRRYVPPVPPATSLN